MIGEIWIEIPKGDSVKLHASGIGLGVGVGAGVHLVSAVGYYIFMLNTGNAF